MTVETGTMTRAAVVIRGRGRWWVYALLLMAVLALMSRDRVAGPQGSHASTSEAAAGDARDALLLPTH